MIALPGERNLLSHRILEVPERGEDDPSQGRHRALGPLTIAHGLGRSVVVAWVRTRSRGPVKVLVGGIEASDGGVLLDFPPGARGCEQSQRAIDTTLSGLAWEQARLALDADTVVADSAADRLEDLFGLTGEPMGYLVVARPLVGAVTPAIDALSDEIATLEALKSGRGVHRRRLARAEQNLEYLDRSTGVGCWELELWTGGATSSAARTTAAMLAGSGDLAEVPLLVRPSSAEASSQYAWAGIAVVGADVVAALARPPFRELPGVRVTPLPDFDQNLEETIQVRLGSILDGTRSSAAPFGVSLDSLNRHVFVSGATGAGKSETVRSLLWSLNQRKIPWLVIEPAKAEYAALARWLDPQIPLVVIRPGDAAAPPPMINPLEPSSIVVGGTRRLFPLQTHLDMVKALFTASFDADEPFPQVLSAGLTRAYRARGWNLVTGTASDTALSAPVWPVLGDLVSESLNVIEGLGYSTEIRNNVRGFIRVRVESLRSGTPGRFFEGGYPLDLEDLLSRPTVFEIEDLGDDKDKAFFIGNLIIRVVELLRLRQRYGSQATGLSHVLVIEEAHRLLRRVAEDGASASAVTMFANLLAEVRAYGEGVVVAEQIPSKVIPDLVKNSAVKLMHRLPAHDDRDAVGATMNLTEAQSVYVVAIEPGVAVAHSAGMDRPVLVRIDRVSDRPETGAGTSAPRLARRVASIPEELNDQRFTLGELESARDLVVPAVGLWAEQVVVAHLTNDVIGTPVGAWFDRLRAADNTLARLAIGLAVHDSVARRFVLVRSWHDPAEFTAVMSQLMAAQLVSGRGLDRPRERWSVGQYRFGPVRRALENRTDADDVTCPHPLSCRWRRVGIDLPGPTWKDQLAQMDVFRTSSPRVRPHELMGSPAVLDDLARSLGQFGGTEQTRIARAIGALGLERRWLVHRVGARGE